MGVKKSSRAGKGSYAVYKAAGQAFKNKIAKLVRHMAKFPEDEGAKKALADVRKNGYTGRSAPKRSSARMIRLPGSDVPVSLNLLAGRLSYEGQMYQEQKAEYNAAQRMAQHEPKQVREAAEKARAETRRKTEALEAKRDADKQRKQRFDKKNQKVGSKTAR